MTRTAIIIAVSLATLMLGVASASADMCTGSIAKLQAQADAAIEARVAAQPWQSESLSALRGYQPTPRSLATAGGSAKLQRVLSALDRARSADRAGDLNRCNHELARATAGLRRSSRLSADPSAF